jgi:surface protein
MRKLFLTTVLSFMLLIMLQLNATAQNPFVTIWKTDNAGISNSNQVRLSLGTTGLGSLNIYWEEVGNTSNNATLVEPVGSPIIITFPAVGIYRIAIAPTSNFLSVYYSGSTDKLKLLEIEQWGDVVWSNFSEAFQGCANLIVTATDIPNLSNANTLRRMFSGCTSLTTVPGMNNWDISNINNTSEMFRDATNFNEPIGNWNTSNVTDMDEMFRGATSFNQPIDNWNVSNVSRMTRMFYEASSFNQSLANWDVSNTVVFQNMFRWASSFNQSLASWNMKRVSITASDLLYMLSGCAMDCNNYSQTLIGWGNNTEIPNGTINFVTGLEYGNDAIAPRDVLISKGWIISDVLDVNCQPIANPAPAAPSNLTTTVFKTQNTNIRIQWADNANNEDGFKVERSEDGTTFTEIADLTANTFQHEDLQLSETTTYYYRVLAYNANGSSTFSNVAQATTGISTDINEKASAINVYPNPVSAYLIIDFKGKEANGAKLNLMNAIGQTIKEVSVNATTTHIPISDIPSGYYFYQIINQNEVLHFGKLIKN